MLASLTVLYRGVLSSCNYSCGYCPFAKHQESAAERQADRRSLRRFTAWAQQQSDLALKLFFTPWGEALIRKHYQQALITLSQTAHIEKVVFQTNLSGRLDFLQQADKNKVALWVTYHPGEVALVDFLRQIDDLITQQIRFSVGVVGKPSHFAAITELRAALAPEIYLWVNAYRSRSRCYPYKPEQFFFLNQIDPLFNINAQDYQSLGKACLTGEQVISVDQHGTIRRCHFIDKKLGNIYQQDYRSVLIPRPCSRNHCQCHIGYVHMPERQLYPLFGDGVLERIPSSVSMS
ncbi:STM4011 family radical SAM protein [Serratia microhaemolytica]|uniref:STM4011 family radical SAM protein n=1 Tax=Serratia microhaemolytica TaxID=2675110 RepID=UPI000FDF2317|nr:STM4011 family radical SAM protein [Serratia microhaemolytica]